MKDNETNNRRLKAEQLLSERKPILKPENVDSLIHELQVHQIELELQNKELRDVESRLEEFSQKYFDLYNFAPVGYLTLDEKELIKDINITGATLLNYEREYLINNAFIRFIPPEFRNNFYKHLKLVLENGTSQNCEIKLIKKDGTQFYAHLEILPVQDADGNLQEFRITATDITASTKIGEDLKMHAALLDVSNEAIFSWNYGGKILSWNQGAEELYGYSDKETIGFSSHELLKTEFPLEFNEIIEKLVNDKMWAGELIHTKKDGEKIIVESQLQLIQDTSGQKIVIESNRDITQRKRVENELSESEEELTKVLNAVPAAVWIAQDPEGRHITGNKLSYELLQLPQGVEASKSAPENERPETFKIFKDGIEMIPEEMPVQLSASGKELRDYEFDLVYSDGTQKNMLGNSTPLFDDDGNPRGSVSAFIDITKRKNVEIELKETLNKLEEMVEERTKDLFLANNYNRNLIETALDPLVTIGPDGKITDVNKATENVTGYSREELIGTDFADYFTNPVEAKKGYQHVFKSGMVRDYPLEIKHKDGSLTPVLYNASVYKDEFNDVVGVFAAARDITERKKAEKELKKYWENLEEQVKLRTSELAKSNADLKQFAYVASHDLREPLRMIINFLQLLERRYQDQLDDDAQEFIFFAVDGAKRLDTMIIDLLEYSRVANKEMMFSEVDFVEVLDQINLNLNVIINENNAKITYDQLPKNIRADENQMILLFQNLITNAIKYRSNERPEIHVSAEKEDDQYLFNVKDNGMSINPEHLERIFTIFQRLHTHHEYEGSGIGLSIAQRIVHQHGGEIWAESEPGKGSTFKFTIKI
ncbi:MAG: PAS domain S-box protein [Methanobacterium sp.]|uniref:PAS domain-containing sensor histidine kinase n=1 Tax=Methanobacterium sp. TaxID=2164 RepID=UPI003D65A9AE|nr:PAS domain S-box protein [Methanobacterium sp.]